MTEFCAIPPLEHLGETEGQSHHLALAHLFFDRAYSSFYRKQTMHKKFVILDNSQREGYKFDVQLLLLIAKQCEANEIVLPDLIQKGTETVDAVHKAMSDVVHLKGVDIYWQPTWMIVPQGKEFTSWTRCFHELLKVYHSFKEYGVFQKPPTIGFPIRYLDRPEQVNFSPEIVSNRIFPMLQKYCETEGGQVHILGWDRSPWKYIPQLVQDFSSIRSVDSAKPFWMLPGRDLTQGRPTDFFTRRLTPEERGIARNNIAMFRDRLRTSLAVR